MLEKLFTSKTRVKLLQLFVLNPDKSYAGSDMARQLKLKPGAIKKELENLQRLGLAVPAESVASPAGGEEKKEKGRGFRLKVDQNFILFEEIRALIIKAQILNQQNLLHKIGRLGRVKLLLLTGIFVNDPFSPIDLLVVGRINKIKLFGEIRELERELGKELNFTYLDTSEFIYRRNMTDVFLYEILEGKKIVLIDELNR